MLKDTTRFDPSSVVRISDRPDMTSTAYRGCKASTQRNKQIIYIAAFVFAFAESRFSHDVVQFIRLGGGRVTNQRANGPGIDPQIAGHSTSIKSK